MSRPSIPNTFTPERKAIFLAVLEDTASPKAAAAAAGIVRSTAFYHKANDLEFRTQWEAAVEVALDSLLEEAYRRAAVGVDEPVIHQGRVSTVADPETGDERPLTVRKYSDTLTIFLLKAHDPDKYRENSRMELTGANGGPVQISDTERAARIATILAAAKARKDGDVSDLI